MDNNTGLQQLKNKALRIAVNAHEGQTDWNGEAYIFHPIRVAVRCKRADEAIVALLHDTIEDTPVTAEYLIAEGFPQYIVDAVLSVTKIEGESYDDFVARAARNPIGRIVKLHDLEDNMDITRDAIVDERAVRLYNKYLKAYRFLIGGQTVNPTR